MELAELKCDGQNDHQRVEGISQGQMRSVLIQGYPRKLIRHILCGFSANKQHSYWCWAISQADVQHKTGETANRSHVQHALKKMHINLGHASQADMVRN